MGQSERLYAGKQPIHPLHPGQWTVVAITPWGWGQGRGLAPSPHKPCPDMID
ncbi:hypothetical protein MBBA_1284 [Methanoculleus bourgensis]|jgi:hypothetical protein|nr:hypothetical protein MBBA_1284 [Methanoculleus bourgensis]